MVLAVLNTVAFPKEKSRVMVIQELTSKMEKKKTKNRVSHWPKVTTWQGQKWGASLGLPDCKACAFSKSITKGSLRSMSCAYITTGQVP